MLLSNSDTSRNWSTMFRILIFTWESRPPSKSLNEIDCQLMQFHFAGVIFMDMIYKELQTTE